MRLQLDDLRKLKGQVCSLDTETDGLAWWRNKVIGISVCCPALNLQGYISTCHYEEIAYPTGRSKKVWTGEYNYPQPGETRIKNSYVMLHGKRTKIEMIVPAPKKEKIYREERTEQILTTAIPHADEIAQARDILLDVASDPATCIIFHNSRFDCHMLNLDLLNKPCMVMDTSIMVHLYDSRLKKGLDNCEQAFLGKNSKRDQVQQAPKGLKKKIWHWPLEIVEEYAENDAVVTFQLAETLSPLLRKLKLIDLLKIQMEYSKVLWRMERRGMLLNTEFRMTAIQAFTDNQKLMVQDLYDAVGYEFNWQSNQQLSKAIYENLGIAQPANPYADKEGKKAKKDGYNEFCTSKTILTKTKHPLGPLIQDIRETAKLRTDVVKFGALVDSEGVIHTNFNQVRTLTGRLSSSKPNLQNLASANRKRETESEYSGGARRVGEYNLRQAFKARPGYTFVSIDHSQQEQRLFAIVANEPVMLEALAKRLDIHLMIALAVWGDCGPERNKLHRSWSKALSFGLLYGMSLDTLRRDLGKTQAEAEVIFAQYFGRFPRIQPWFEETTNEMYKRGYVRYWSGRIWREDQSKFFYRACNAVIQGGAADLVQIAVLRLAKVCEYQDWGAVVSIIHDEVLLEIRNDFLIEALPVLVRIMEVEDIFGLPFKAEAKYGLTYGQLDTEVEFDELSAVDWTQYLPPNTDMRKLSLVAIKQGGK